MKLSNSMWNKLVPGLWVVALALAVFALPYLIPREPTVSLSYEVGFNNRVAVVAFVCVAFAFAFSMRGRLGKQDLEDRGLSIMYLLGSTVVFEFLLAAVFRHHGQAKLGSEAHYFMDRQHLLAIGRLPYRQFEFAYGPLLIYPTQLLYKLLHLSLIMSYHLALFLSWAVGLAILYYVLASLQIPSRSRGGVYLLLCVGLLPWILWEGLNYTPARNFSAAFLAIAAYAVWQRTRSAPFAILAATLAIALGFGVSAEQGIGLAFGLPVYYLLLSWRGKSFPLRAALGLAFLSVLVVAAIWRMQLLVTMQAFSHGGYNFPLLPSPTNVVILAVYLCAVFFLVQRFLARDLDNNAVLLVLCGLPMLVAAFGRCDFGHLMSASPAWLVGLSVVYGHSKFRKVLMPLLWIAMVVPLGFWVHDRLNPPQPLPAVSLSGVPLQPAPTTTMYYSPFLPLIPPDSAVAIRVPLDEGYYSAMVNVTTPEQMQQKLAEFQSHAEMPWILPDVVNAETPLLGDRDPHVLARLEQYPFALPSLKTPSLDASLLTAYIRTHCQPTQTGQSPDPPSLITGFRVWNCHA